MIYLKLFLTFFKIGLFSFGGGYAMLPMIKNEIVNMNGWLTLIEFTNIVAISQVTPGPIAINSATYVGYTVTQNVFGAFVSTFGVSLPSIIVMLILCKFVLKFKDNMTLKNAFKGLRPTVVGLILAAAVMLINKVNFIDYKSVVIFLVSLFLFLKYNLNPILMLLGSAIVGLLIY